MAIALRYVRRLKSGRLEFRRAFSTHVKTYLKRHELIVSLEAQSLSQPGAAERYRAALTKYEQLVSTAQKAIKRTFDELDRPRIAWLVESYEAAFLEADDAARLAGTSDPDNHDGCDNGWRDVLEHGDVAEIRAMFHDDAVALGAKYGWVFDVESEAFAALCLDLLRASVRANALRMERDRGNPVPTPVAPHSPPETIAGGTRLSATRSRSFDSLVKEEMGRPTFTGGASTKQSWNTALRYLREVHGTPAPEEITRQMASDLVDALALAPVKRVIPSKLRGRPLPDLIEAFAGKDIERHSRKSRATILGSLQAAWTRCQRSGRVADERANPFARPNLGKAAGPRKNDGLTQEECRAIFSTSIFAKGERPTRGRGEASFWLPILLLTTGARPEELAQSLISDVCEAEGHGGLVLSISAVGQHPHKGPRNLKTPSAERIIPLPAILMGLGFGDYVDWLKAKGELALFPSLRTKGERGELFPSDV